MPVETVVETEGVLDRSMLNEMVHWVKTLHSVGVSPDVAAQVTKDLLVTVCTVASEEELDLDTYDDEED